MNDWQFFAQMRHLIQHDPGGRGLDRVAGRSLVSLSAPDLEAACRSLAGTRRLEVAIVTGFYVARAESYETDGPLGAIFLAEVLHRFGAGVTILAEAGCNAVHEVALRLNGLEDHVHLKDLPSADHANFEQWRAQFWQQHPHLTHLVAIERVGPSHSLQSLMQQYGNQPAPLGTFVQEVDAISWNRPHNMRGYDLAAFTSPAHHLFETLPAGVQSIGIGDGGNEIGMGKLPWDVIRANIEGGGKIACRIPTHQLIVAGTSNWGAYALAAGVAWLKMSSSSPVSDRGRTATPALPGVFLQPPVSLHQNEPVTMDAHLRALTPGPSPKRERGKATSPASSMLTANRSFGRPPSLRSH